MDLALNTAAGLLLATGLPTLNFWPIAFVGLIPLFRSMERVSRGSFLIGLTFGMAYNYASIFWLNAIWPFAPSKLFSIAGVLLLAFYCALYHGLFAWIGRKIWLRNPLLAPLALGSLWTVLEWIRSLGPLAFPWAYLGHTQSSNLPFIQMADIGGTFLISFVLALINFLLYLIFFRRTRPLIPLFAVAILIIASYGYGTWLIKSTAWTSGPELAVGVSQPNIEQIDKYLSYAHPDRQLRLKWQNWIESVQFQQIREIRKAQPDTKLYVMPETSFTQSDFQRDKALQARIVEVAREVGGSLFFGADNAEVDPSADRERLYVAAWMADPQRGMIEKAYNKMRLVPFGESLPFFEYIPYFQDKVLGMGTFDRGRDYVLFTVDGLRFGCGICFESAAPRQMARVTREGAQFLAVITNDAWYYHRLWKIDKRGAPQHDALSTFRAIENRRWLIRSANTGISRIIDPKGRTVAVAPREELAFLTGRIHALSAETFYTRWGGWFMLVFWILFGAGWLKPRGGYATNEPL